MARYYKVHFKKQTNLLFYQILYALNFLYLHINKFFAHQPPHQKIAKIFLVIFKEKVNLVPLAGTLFSFTVFGLSTGQIVFTKLLHGPRYLFLKKKLCYSI